MEIQAKPIFKVKTPRIKAIAASNGFPEVLVCNMMGEVQLYSAEKLKMTRSAKISKEPLRTGVIIPSKDMIVVGGDEGVLFVLNIVSLAIQSKVKAHDDFIRKIVVDEENQKFITVSDDNRTKLWSFKDMITLIHTYKESKHFVMDASFCPSNKSLFVVGALDCKARLYTVEHTKCLKTFRGHEKGINTVEFISEDIFLTGADDHRVIVWDYRRNVPITVLEGHTNNVLSIHKLSKGFATCGEDTSVRFWSSDYKTIDVRNAVGRVWSLCEKSDRIFIGSDEELMVYSKLKNEIHVAYSNAKLFFTRGNSVHYIRPGEYSLMSKEDEIVGDSVYPINKLCDVKNLGELEEAFRAIKSNSNGKYLAVLYEYRVVIYSALGLRKKLEVESDDIIFTGEDAFVFRRKEALVFYTKLEQADSRKIPGLRKLLYADPGIAVVVLNGEDEQDTVSVIDLGAGSRVLYSSPNVPEFVVRVQDYFVFCGAKLIVYDREFHMVGAIDSRAQSIIVEGDAFIWSTASKIHVGFIVNSKVQSTALEGAGRVVGVHNNDLYLVTSDLCVKRIDFEYIDFQKAVLKGERPAISERLKYQAMMYYESLGMHKEALQQCTDDNQRFEILLRLGDFDEAYRMASSSAKYRKLGEAYFRNGNAKSAASCFYMAGNIQNLLIADVFGERKYLGELGEAAKKGGANNLAFMAFYKNREYEKCALLLRETVFYKPFCKFYLNQ